MMSNTFIEVLDYKDEPKCINLNWIKRFDQYSEDETIITFEVEDYLIVKCTYQKFKDALTELGTYIKKTT